MTDQVITKLKRKIVLAAHSAGEGHIPSSLSILDILWVLYDRVMKLDPLRPGAPDRDRFILSKGHGSLALYAVLAEKGILPREELESFCRFDSRLGGHPDCNKVPGIEASTGSLGHGFPMAVGLALGAKIRRAGHRVFCLVGDGESNEGTVWESALLAAHHGLSNLCCIVDYNHSTDRALRVSDLAAKFASFDWRAVVVDGHDHEQIHQALLRPAESRPLVIVAETTKGRGIARMENAPAWHHRAPNDAELKEITEELA